MYTVIRHIRLNLILVLGPSQSYTKEFEFVKYINDKMDI